eukprot:GHVS01045647.1.p1 GENE.GHVS01045647.1~~GHVS01045647.1.p1  ORF type:complete len:324 (-),score=48.64 GHVS01045647.1:105-1010(-)
MPAPSLEVPSSQEVAVQSSTTGAGGRACGGTCRSRGKVVSTHAFCQLKEFGVGQLTKHNCGQLRVLLECTLPIAYPEKFYTDILSHTSYSRYGYIGDIMVGSICCRVEPEGRLHVVALSVLEPYRRFGIGSELLGYVLNKASSQLDTTSRHRRDDQDSSVSPDSSPNTSTCCGPFSSHGGVGCSAGSTSTISLSECYLHVWTENKAAIHFYERFGFHIAETVPSYYKELDPPDAVLISCKLPWTSEALPHMPVLVAGGEDGKKGGEDGGSRRSGGGGKSNCAAGSDFRDADFDFTVHNTAA